MTNEQENQWREEFAAWWGTNAKEYSLNMSAEEKLDMWVQAAFMEAKQSSQSIIDEQLQTIAALNICIGGEGSLTTDNLTRNARLQDIIDVQAQEIEALKEYKRAHSAYEDKSRVGMGLEIEELRRKLAEHQAAFVRMGYVGKVNGKEELELLLSEARKVPEGWKLVPVKPSRGMMRAAKEADMSHDTFDEWMFSDGDDLMRVYAAMLNASPEYKERT